MSNRSGSGKTVLRLVERRGEHRPGGDTLPAPTLFTAWAIAGLGRFAAATNSGGTALKAMVAALPPGDWSGEWSAISARVVAALASAPPFARLLARAGDVPSAWVAALAAVVEHDHLACLAVAELQAGGGGPRPTVHLTRALLRTLFGDAPPGAPAQGLVAGQVLTLRGDGPLPLAELAMDPRLWAVLGGAPPPWPDVAPLGEEQVPLPAAIHEAIHAAAEHILAGGAPVVVLRGPPHSGRSAAAATLARLVGRRAVSLPVERFTGDGACAAAADLAGWLPVLAPRMGPGETQPPPRSAGYTGPIALVLGSDGAIDHPRAVVVPVGIPDLAERRAFWSARLDDPALVETASQAAVGAVALGRLAGALGDEGSGDGLQARFAAARRALAGDALRLLAQPVERPVPRDALVMPGEVARELDQLLDRCRRRESLWEGLGTTARSVMSRGVRALFVGESGTGKTLAAAWLATELATPLYRVDLASVMNKYIGESEKNLGRLLDLAAAHDVILLFDEADALFGSRGDGGETGERYANMLTNFLLTRIEEHPGIVVLTSNSRVRIDPAFVRRLDAVIDVSLPGPGERERLWRAHLGDRFTDLDCLRLIAGHCDLAGGHVRSAVLAAASQCPGAITPLALVAALAREYRKLGRQPPAALAYHG
jgi:hypothetical protein